MHTDTETDEEGDLFEAWLVKRTFALLAPVSRLGLAVELLFLCVADPLYRWLDLWSRAVPHAWLMAWHATMALFFGLALWRVRRTTTHAGRLRLLRLFIAGGMLLFVWFGVVSWLGTGDLSVVAIAQVMLASILCIPGGLRRWAYWLQALALFLLLAGLDASGRFLGEMQYANLLVMAAVAHAVDGYVMAQARALFSGKCHVVRERRRADAVLYNALPPAIAEELKAHHRVRAQSFPAMAILFADIVGFTRYAAGRSPGEVLAVLNALFTAMDHLIAQHRVEKIKTMGDAYLVVSKDRPQALAQLALAMDPLLQRFNAVHGLHFALRIGLHCGPAIAGVIGDQRPLYDVWGEAVNLASRLESSAPAGRIQASQQVFEALRTHFAFEARGTVDIRGMGRLPTYFLLGPQATADGVIASGALPATASGYTP